MVPSMVAEESKRVSEAVPLLLEFLTREGCPLPTAARELGVTRQAITKWINGIARPEFPRRNAIERWSAGAVPADAWRFDSERRSAARAARVR